MQIVSLKRLSPSLREQTYMIILCNVLARAYAHAQCEFERATRTVNNSWRVS
jgi:hypothetical protein